MSSSAAHRRLHFHNWNIGLPRRLLGWTTGDPGTGIFARSDFVFWQTTASAKLVTKNTVARTAVAFCSKNSSCQSCQTWSVMHRHQRKRRHSAPLPCCSRIRPIMASRQQYVNNNCFKFSNFHAFLPVGTIFKNSFAIQDAPPTRAAVDIWLGKQFQRHWMTSHCRRTKFLYCHPMTQPIAGEWRHARPGPVPVLQSIASANGPHRLISNNRRSHFVDTDTIDNCFHSWVQKLLLQRFALLALLQGFANTDDGGQALAVCGSKLLAPPFHLLSPYRARRSECPNYGILATNTFASISAAISPV